MPVAGPAGSTVQPLVVKLLPQSDAIDIVDGNPEHAGQGQCAHPRRMLRAIQLR